MILSVENILLRGVEEDLVDKKLKASFGDICICGLRDRVVFLKGCRWTQSKGGSAGL